MATCRPGPEHVIAIGQQLQSCGFESVASFTLVNRRCVGEFILVNNEGY
jgi:hypothetical protein